MTSRPDPGAWLRAADRALRARIRDERLLTAARSSAAEDRDAVAAPAAGRLLAIARKPTRRAHLELLGEATITRERGLEGNANGRPGRRQITVVTREGWDAACRDVGVDAPWVTRRANLLVEGLTLARRVGSRLVLGDVMLEITGETTPCTRMDEQIAGLTAALAPEWRAGVTCRVLAGGVVRVGDTVELADPRSG
jgi:MOSC domain-containing protein YiiM